MKRVIMVAVFLLAMAGVVRVMATPSEVGVSAAGSGIFPSGAEFGGVALSASEFAAGVVVEASGWAEGHFHTVLSGTAVLGQPREITVEGEVTGGTLNGDGGVTLSGTSTVDMGDGTLLLRGVPFSLTLSTQGLQLVLGATTLPAQSLSPDAFAID